VDAARLRRRERLSVRWSRHLRDAFGAAR
jgi:hypothetical protein